MAENNDINTPFVEFSRLVRFNRISKAKTFLFDEKPTEGELRSIASSMDMLSVRKMRFTGHLAPLDKEGWALEGKLGVTVTQACVITLEPVRTRLDLDIRRQYLPEPDKGITDLEIEIPEDDEIEQLESTLDLGLLALEALALALPDYPKIEGAELPKVANTEKDDSDEDSPKPFAGLAALKNKLENDS